MRFGSLFSGIGLMDLGLERAGWTCAGQCEIEPFGQIILRKHWPDVWRWNDVRTLSGESIREHCGHLDALVAGVPCQPASAAGQRRGALDHRWMWPEFLRLVSETRPLWVLAENPDYVLSLRVEGRSFRDWIEDQFQSLGYSLFIGKFGADCLGAPHVRQRVWIVAQKVGNAPGIRRDGHSEIAKSAGASQTEGRLLQLKGAGEELAYDNGHGKQQSEVSVGEERRRTRNGSERESALADSQGERLQARCLPGGNSSQFSRSADLGPYQWPAGQRQFQHEWEEPREIRDSEIKSSLGLAADGRSTRLARRWRARAIEAVGNGAVVAAAEAVGRAILEAEAALTGHRSEARFRQDER